MSDTINPTGFNDPVIDVIRAQVNAKSDQIPFLLLPIKIETRFMKVDQPILDKDVFSDVLESLFEVDDYMKFNPAKLPTHEVLGRERKLANQFMEIGKKAGDIKRLSAEELEHLRVKLVEIEKAHKNLSQGLSRLSWENMAKSRELMNLKNETAKEFHHLSTTIKQLKSSDGQESNKTDHILDNIETLKNTIQEIGRKNFSSSDRKEKKLIFEYADAHISRMEQAMNAVKKDMNINLESTPSQLIVLGRVGDELNEELSNAWKNISTIKSEYKKSIYHEKLNQIKAKVSSLRNDIDWRFRPKMEMRINLKTVTARELLWKIHKFRFRLKQQNRRRFRTFDEVNNTREKLFKELAAIRVNAFHIIEGNEEDLKALSKAWDDADSELEKLIQRVQAFKGLEKQKPELAKTVETINKEFREDLSGLKSASKSRYRRLTNSALEKSAIHYTSTLKKLKEIKEEINRIRENPRSAISLNGLKQVAVFMRSIPPESDEIHVLPEKYYNELNNLSSEILLDINSLVSTPEISRTLEEGDKKSSSDAITAAYSIKTAVESYASDTMDRNYRLEKGERSPLIFATKTITLDELWVRFYPDDIAIHTHEEALTEEEVEAGKAYWFEIWAAGDDYEVKLAAWRAIHTAYGSQRAAWIVKTMEPKDSDKELVRAKFNLVSKEGIHISDNLKKISDQLKVEGNTRELILVLGQTYPLIKGIEEEISKIKGEHAGLLSKTQNYLLKVQSQVNAIIRKIQKTSEIDKVSLEGGLEIINPYINSFNRIAESFKKIKKISSREIIRKTAVPENFPEVKTKEGNWTVAPHSNVMPDRFEVVTMARDGQYKHLVVGKPLPSDKLIVGLDPETFETETFQYDVDGNLIVDENIKWLTDFNEAKNKGMAVSIALDEKDLAEGFEKVFVLGVKNTTEQESKELLEKLIDNHHFLPEGASFLPIATPTNNTEAGESGYRTFEEDAALSFSIERNNEEKETSTSDPEFPSDAERLAEGLGIDPGILKNLDYHNRTEVSEALVMNKALFPGTLGNYMEEGLDMLFTLDNIQHTKDFFCNNVSARGFLPSLRVGTQPYGILATTAFSQFNATADDSFIPTLNQEDFDNPSLIQDELQIRYDIRLKNLLFEMDNLWTAIRNEKVAHAGNTNPEDPQGHFIEMLGLQANSAEYFYRYGLNVAAREAATEAGGFSISFDSDDPWSPAKVAEAFKHLVFPGYYFKSDRFADERIDYPTPIDQLNSKNSRISDQFAKARVFETRHLKDQAQLLGDFIDNRDLSGEIVEPSNPDTGTEEEKHLARAELQNFIDWLVDQNPWDVHAENKFSEISDDVLKEGMPSKSLLFLLLRHSVLSAYVDAILKILEFEGLTDQATRKIMGQPSHYYSRFGEGYNYVTKWTYLFSEINRLDNVLGFGMDNFNAFYIYMSSLSGTGNGYLNRYLSPAHTFVFNNYPNHHQHQGFVDELEATRNAIRKLKEIPTLRLEQLLTEHIDLCTYRLDAWKLGLVNKRLQKQREANNSGVYLGSYGWVEDLKKGGERIIAKNLPEGLWKNGDDPVYSDEDNQGFIHTPSLNHAITAAILRAGFNANSDTAEVNNQMAVNLSSERVRIGLNLLNGISTGQDAAALLGYQFERGLHERYLHVPLELDEYIYDFREEFPLSVSVDESVSIGEAQFSNVVNGMELLEAAQDFIESHGGPPNPGDNLYQSLKAFETLWWDHIGNLNIIAASPDKRDAMLKEIDRMADAFDALGDLCISESVYQVAQGNHIRASAIMDKLAKGDVPNNIEIADTPRTGTVVTHKVAIFFEVIAGIDHELTESGAGSVPVEESELDTAVLSAGAQAIGWTSRFTPRAVAEPSLNKWIGKMIGDPVKIKCQIEYSIAGILNSLTVTLADLEIQPLDALHLFGTGPLDGGAELNARIARRVKNVMLVPADFDGTVDDAEINIQYTKRNGTWLGEDSSFYEKAGYIQSLRSLITDSAILAADSMLIPGEEEVEIDGVRNQEVDEYLIRISNLKARLEILQADWNTFFADEITAEEAVDHTFTEAQIDAMRALLIRTSDFGIPGSIPDALFKYGNEVGLILIGASDGASKAISNRLKQVTKDMEVAKDLTKSNDIRVGAIQEAAKKLLGKAFVMVPHFTLRNATDVSAQLSLVKEKGLLRAFSPLVMEKWSHGLARVRERMAGLDEVQMWAENFGMPFPEKNPLQFPFLLDEDGNSVDHWLGVEFPDGYAPTEDKLSLILMNAEAITSSPETAKSALLIDEWVEIIPNMSETTAITFNYDQPNAKAPNTLLLAVTPKETGTWSWDNLVFTLNDTLEMSKNRAVEPEHLENTVFGQTLPAILTEVVPPQLLPDDADSSGDAQNNPMGLQVVTDFGVVNDTYEPETEE